MDSIKGSRPVQPPVATTEAETATIQAHVLEAGKTDKDTVVESYGTSEDGTSTPKKAPDGGMKNYFVRRSIDKNVPAANVQNLAGLCIRNKIGPSPHHTMLSQLYRFRRHYPVDECSLWYVKQLAACEGADCV
jgi:hypothetical protein